MASLPPEAAALTRTCHRPTAADGTRICLRSAEHAAARARILIVHGYSDHGARYEHVIDLLGARGFSVAAGDLRGHGESAGRRGHIERFEQYLDDVSTMIAQLRAGEPAGAPLPLFLMGHSLGGLLAACHVQGHPDSVDGVVIAAPFVTLKFPVPSWKRALARVASRLWPAFSLPSGLPTDLMSHDPVFRARFEDDPLVFRRATARWYTETAAAQVRALSRGAQTLPPRLLLLAGDDRIVCNDAARRLHAAMGTARSDVREYPHLYHDLFHELDHAQVVEDVAAWIDRQLAERPSCTSPARAIR